MNILSIDTSGRACSVAISTEKELLHEAYINNGLTHSQTFMKLADECFRESGIRKEEIDIVAVTNGPGSFTGLRIGMSAAKAFALALNCRIACISTLDCLYEQYRGSGRKICSLMDARSSRAFCQIRDDNTVYLEPGVYDLDYIMNYIDKETDGNVLFTGDALNVYMDRLSGLESAEFAPEKMRLSRAASLAPIAVRMAENGQLSGTYDAELDYFLESQAERNYGKK